MRAGRPSFSDATASAAGEALRQASMASSKAQFTRDNLVAYMRWVRASRGVMQLAGKVSWGDWVHVWVVEGWWMEHGLECGGAGAPG